MVQLEFFCSKDLKVLLQIVLTFSFSYRGPRPLNLVLEKTRRSILTRRSVLTVTLLCHPFWKYFFKKKIVHRSWIFIHIFWCTILLACKVSESPYFKSNGTVPVYVHLRPEIMHLIKCYFNFDECHKVSCEVWEWPRHL